MHYLSKGESMEKREIGCDKKCSLRKTFNLVQDAVKDYDVEKNPTARVRLNDILCYLDMAEGLDTDDCKGMRENPQTNQSFCPNADLLNAAVNMVTQNSHALQPDGNDSHLVDNLVRQAEVNGTTQATAQYFGGQKMEQLKKQRPDIPLARPANTHPAKTPPDEDDHSLGQYL